MFSVLIIVSVIAGCAATPKNSAEPAHIKASVLPIQKGGIVAVEATGLIPAFFEKASTKLILWEKLILSQKGTIDAKVLDLNKNINPQLPKQLQKIDCDNKPLLIALKNWINPSGKKPVETISILDEIKSHKMVPSFMCEIPKDKKKEKIGITIFGTSRDTLCVLGDIRSSSKRNKTILVEINFFVSSSYKSGINIYQVKKIEGGRTELNIQIYSWISQAEGFFGAIPRKIAESELLKQAKITWQDVAMDLGSNED